MFCAGTLIALFIGIALGARTLIGSFEQVETAATEQKTIQVYRAFEADLAHLDISNRDYAEWDEAADFVDNGNPHFIASNFVPQTLIGVHVDTIWIVDRSGHEIYSCFIDRRNGKMTSPAPRSLLQGLQRYLSNDARLMQLSPAERIVTTPRGLAAVSAREIKRTDLSGPTGAIMLFARFIEDEEIQRVRDTSQLPVSLTYLTAGGSEIASLPSPVRVWATAVGTGSRSLVRATDERSIAGYTLIRNADHVPVALFTTQSRRDIFALGYRTTWYLLGSFGVLFIAFGTAVVWLLLRLQRSSAAQHAGETRHRYIGAQLHEAIVLVDAKTYEIVEANETVLRALRCSLEQLSNRSVQDIFPDITAAALAQTFRDGGRKVLESRSYGKSGGKLDTEVAITSMTLLGRQLLTLVGHDISHRREAEERERAVRRKLLQLAQHDSLTKLPNRLYLHSRLPRVLRKVAQGDRLLALIYLDLDHFKNINDSRGHGCGDQLLQVVAQRLRAAVGAHDLVARMGGDEFVVVASLLADAEAVTQLAALLRAAVQAPVMIEGEPLTVTASLGVAVYPRDGLDVETLLKYADIALYHAKEAGRDCYRLFAADMDVKVSEEVALEQALRHAIGTDQIYMEYQPVIEMRTGRVASLEALMRWRHPELGLIPPSQFIPVAEKSGLIVQLGQQALQHVLSRLRGWIDANVPIVPVAVNVSPLQFERTDFAAVVAQLAADASVKPCWLRFEITESAVMKEPQKLIGTLETLRLLGSEVLIDDFGTGFSSLSYLSKLPVDTLKIDRSFVHDLGRETARKSIINAVLDMAKRLNLKTIAEGVETAEQAEVLLELGCEFGQGYFYSKPVTARHCRALLEELRRELPLTETMLVRTVSSDSTLSVSGSSIRRPAMPRVEGASKARN